MACVIALVSLLLIVATPSPHHHQTHKENAAAKQEHSKSIPVSTLSNKFSPKPTPTETRNYSYSYYYPTSKSESPPVWFQELTAFVLLVFTGGLWWTSVRQWRAIKEQARIANDTLIETRKAADAAKDGAKAAGEQAATSARAFEMTLCGEVRIDAVSMIFGGTTPTIYFAALNTGHRQVQIIEQVFSLWYKPTDAAYPIEFPTRSHSPIPIPDTFPAHTRATDKVQGDAMITLVFPSGDAWHLHSEGKLLICFSAYVGYTDHIGEHHGTFTCVAWDRIANRFVIPPDMPPTYNRST